MNFECTHRHQGAQAGRRGVLRGRGRVDGRHQAEVAQGAHPARGLPVQARRQPVEKVRKASSFFHQGSLKFNDFFQISFRVPDVQRWHPGHRGHGPGGHLRGIKGKEWWFFFYGFEEKSIMNSLQVQGLPPEALKNQRFVVAGAGSAASGVLLTIRNALTRRWEINFYGDGRILMMAKCLTDFSRLQIR